MDDILLFYSKNDGWDHKKFLKDFQESKCYWKPLKLEEAQGNVFLETRFEANSMSLVHRLKNQNENQHAVWRYQDFRSCLPYGVKRQTLLATLKKVDRMANNEDQLWKSALPILQEFKNLRYPKGILKFMCSVTGRDHNNNIWFKIRDYVDDL